MTCQTEGDNSNYLQEITKLSPLIKRFLFIGFDFTHILKINNASQRTSNSFFLVQVLIQAQIYLLVLLLVDCQIQRVGSSKLQSRVKL